MVEFLSEKMKINRLVIIAGGTGGHIFSGLVICDYFKSCGCLVKWIGTKDRLEFVLQSKYNLDIDFVYIPNFRKNFLFNFFRNIFFFIKSIYLIVNKFKEWNPDLVIGFGGYVSFSGILSAWLCSIPTMIHEQNFIVGLSNKILSHIVTKVVQAFPGTFHGNIPVVGNPIRKELLCFLKPKYRLLNRKGPIKILVVGGSQGSVKLNFIILDLVKRLNMKKYFILHQTGINNYNSVFSILNQKNKVFNYNIVDYIYDMYEVYNWADLIICRSGALTVSEISYVGLASIFIPFLHNDNQQYLNAKFLQDVGASFIVDENNLPVENLINILSKINRNKLFIMSCLAYKKRIKNSNKKFINEIINI